MKVMADIINGVFKVDSFDDFNGADVMSQEDFYSSLPDLSDGEIICADIDSTMARKIEAEYGISFMKKFNYEYNEYVIGYVVNYGDGRSCNFQFDKVFSNHPQPKYELKTGCEGDDTHRQFSDDEIVEMGEFLDSQEDVKETLEAFNTAIYENENFADKTAPIQRWEILEAAETVEE